MRVGIVSDTHLYGKRTGLPGALIEGLQGVELILHAGDWISVEIVEAMEKIAPVESVAGNNDGLDIIERFGRQKMLELTGYRIGLIHGDGYRGTTEQRAFQAFSQDKPDAVIFGHSHIPYMEKREGILLFNPGSPTDKRRQPRYSFGIMELGSTMEAWHVYFDSKE